MAVHHYAELLSFFSRSTGDRDTARDIVQEAYARLCRLESGGVLIGESRALLYRMGRNLLVSDARQRASEARMLQTLALVGTNSAPSVEQHIEARQRLDRLVARLSAMPRKRREAFILVRVHGYSYAEAGERMGVTSQAVDRHIVRAVMDVMARPV